MTAVCVVGIPSVEPLHAARERVFAGRERKGEVVVVYIIR
jgi:hypothetical protein